MAAYSACSFMIATPCANDRNDVGWGTNRCWDDVPNGRHDGRIARYECSHDGPVCYVARSDSRSTGASDRLPGTGRFTCIASS